MEGKFQAYEQHQMLLLPPSLEDLIEEQALVRVVNRVIDQVCPEILEAPFEGGGRPAYHPRMMLKVLVYAYCYKVYSCRKMALALRRDVAFMWLAGRQQPDFRTNCVPAIMFNWAAWMGLSRDVRYTRMPTTGPPSCHTWKSERSRALPKVRLEAMLWSISYNLRKLFGMEMKPKLG